MKFYPVFLRVAGRRCVVVGGGEVAERKVDALVAAGARVSVISPSLTAGLQERLRRAEIEHIGRTFRAGDLRRSFLAYAATDDETLHPLIAREAEEAGALLNVVDQPEWCTFIVPSVARRGDLTVAVSTGGSSPALARRVREDIERGLGPEYERALDVLARLRAYLRAVAMSSAERQQILTRLVASDLLERVRNADAAGVDRLLAEHVGAHVSLASLGAEWR